MLPVLVNIFSVIASLFGHSAGGSGAATAVAAKDAGYAAAGGAKAAGVVHTTVAGTESVHAWEAVKVTGLTLGMVGAARLAGGRAEGDEEAPAVKPKAC